MQTETKLCYEAYENDQNAIPVIIVAAGNSTRMGQNKQFMEILGLPVIVRTLMAFQKSKVVSRIILVVKAEDIFTFQLLAEKYGISKVSDIVCGGENRQQSVLNGFARLSQNENEVLIHDGARPLVSEKTICSVAEALKNCSAATCGVRVKDTIKQTDKNGKILKTVDRSCLFSVQTPQAVRKADYLSAVEKIGDISSFTDDTSIMEAAGYDCFMVEGDYKNIKITTREDIPLAENFLKEEEI
ncbi:MAG: 2-C-methyl-D-erythritol 4-phosphate cytidylyltransferase [Clostridia bacterium]|nr:2-C-methyl-D-erythritol 4-phosphate cytidylyltransferase [Clostridia bacterium]